MKIVAKCLSLQSLSPEFKYSLFNSISLTSAVRFLIFGTMKILLYIQTTFFWFKISFKRDQIRTLA